MSTTRIILLLRNTLIAGMVIVLGGLAGCETGGGAKNTAHLQGTITIDGEPLPADVEASILFKPTQPGQAKSTGGQILAGKYDCPEVPLGTIKVYISIQQRTGRMISEAGGSPFPELKSLTAPKSGSGIELEVQGDNFNQRFDLESA